MAYELVIVGGGNMGAALLGGLLASGTVDVAEVAVVEVDADRLAIVADQFPGVAVADQIPECRSAVLAVKPGAIADVAAAAVAAGARRLLSIAAGVTIAAIETAAASDDVAVVRSMPNTPALVGQGVAAIAGGTHAGPDDVAWAERILAGVGTVVRVDEHQLDAVTGLTGSGPAYVFLVAEALIDAGVDVGLPADDVAAMVSQLLVGASALLAQGGDPAALRRMVTSPNGTTAAGVAVLEQHAVRAAFVDAVRAATARSRQLGSA
jgi:pyrroline-5-carboxylate reductase